MPNKSSKSSDNLTIDDIKSFWNILRNEVKKKYDVDLNKLIGQIALILVILLAASTILAWNIGSGVETKSDIQSDSGNYNIKSDIPNARPSGGDAGSGGMITTNIGVFNISSPSAQSTNDNQQLDSSHSKSGYTAVQTTTGIADILSATIGSTTSVFVMLAIVGVAMSITMGALFSITRVLGLR